MVIDAEEKMVMNEGQGKCGGLDGEPGLKDLCRAHC